MGWSRAGWGGYIKSNATGESIEIVNPSKGYTLADARHDMEPLTKFFVSRVVQPNITTRGSWYDYFEDHFKPLDKHIGGWSAAVSSRLLPPEVFHEDTRPELAKALVQIYESKPNLNLWLMLVTPTKFPHTNNSALHPSWKNAILEVRINERWDQYPDQSAEANRQHFKRVHEAMEPLRKLAPNMAVSINEADIWEQDSHLAYWGQDNHDRLRCIKKRVDPENILSNYGAVNWDQNAERYHCYPRL